ncbi:hypothetical protein LTR12_004013 [Friedmanniomyces endolithicus]|nr:hypothetical protein LTR12_004013 [Friedmanniomyces endolithicus]
MPELFSHRITSPPYYAIRYTPSRTGNSLRSGVDASLPTIVYYTTFALPVSATTLLIRITPLRQVLLASDDDGEICEVEIGVALLVVVIVGSPEGMLLLVVVMKFRFRPPQVTTPPSRVVQELAEAETDAEAVIDAEGETDAETVAAIVVV